MYQIGEFSKINRVTVKALRYYEKVGLLKPAFIDESNGYRYYSSEQLPKIHRIVALRQMDFSINEILLLLKRHNTKEIFQDKRDRLLDEIRQREEQLNLITYYIENSREVIKMNYEVVLKALDEVIVYSKQMKVPNYDYYFEAIPKIGEKIVAANPDLKCLEPNYCFTIYLDGEYKKEDFEVEVCEAVTDYGKPVDDIVFKKMDGIEIAACVYHKGSYDTIGQAYAFLFKWIDENCYEVIGNPRESYIDGIWNKETSDEWLTELQVPIQKKE
ncbi:MAG TPA: MerR family transcriptional regulator [Clostridia bacterium]|nr:MerR family transcriptional regulator [Clostridia bacterium]